jgi:hypothetical protein
VASAHVAVDPCRYQRDLGFDVVGCPRRVCSAMANQTILASLAEAEPFRRRKRKSRAALA